MNSVIQQKQGVEPRAVVAAQTDDATEPNFSSCVPPRIKCECVPKLKHHAERKKDIQSRNLDTRWSSVVSFTL